MSQEITQDPEIRSGAPRIDGTRLTVADVVYTMTYSGVTLDDATSHHPALTK